MTSELIRHWRPEIETLVRGSAPRALRMTNKTESRRSSLIANFGGIISSFAIFQRPFEEARDLLIGSLSSYGRHEWSWRSDGRGRWSLPKSGSLAALCP